MKKQLLGADWHKIQKLLWERLIAKFEGERSYDLPQVEIPEQVENYLYSLADEIRYSEKNFTARLAALAS